jgi:hypothetical protein
MSAPDPFASVTIHLRKFAVFATLGPLLAGKWLMLRFISAMKGVCNGSEANTLGLSEKRPTTTSAMRVLHGPVNVGNQPWTLSRAERALGLDSKLVTLGPSWLGYQSDRILEEPSKKTFAARMRYRLLRAALAFEFNVLHFYFGQSFFYKHDDPSWRYNFADLKLARRLGKLVIMTLQGCDVRMAGLSNKRNEITMCREGGCTQYGSCIAAQDRIREQLATAILPLCDRVFFLNPDLSVSAGTGEFLPYANVDLRAILPQPPRPVRARPLVLHAPTSKSIKGSSIIESSLRRLAKSYDFDYQAVADVPHAQAMKLYAQADLVIDQVLSGWYGGLAVEVMAMGKPVVAYIREGDLCAIPQAMRADLPILRADPRRMDEDLARIFDERRQWPELGAKSRAFVERWHDPERIAAAMARIYRDPRVPLTY